MSGLSTASIVSRKTPKQARSSDLVAAVLDAAIQVLAEQGARRFTTARVAERAGVSVGSLYQYFPNKAAILFRLQCDEWHATTAMMRETLEERESSPADRLRRLVHLFIRSECEEAAMRVALADAAPLYRAAPEASEVRATGRAVMQAFMREALPGVPDVVRTRAGDLISATLSDVGKRFSEQPRSGSEIAVYAGAMADMFCSYLAALEGG